MARASSPIPSSAQTLTVTSASTSTLTVPASARRALIVIEDNLVHYWTDGSTPTTTNGLPGFPAQIINLNSAEAANFKVIAASASSHVHAQYYADELEDQQ